MNRYYYIDNQGVRKGPFTLAELREKCLSEDSRVMLEGSDKWCRAKDVIELKNLQLKIKDTNLLSSKEPCKIAENTIAESKTEYEESSENVLEENKRHGINTLLLSIIFFSVAVVIVICISFFINKQSQSDASANIRSNEDLFKEVTTQAPRYDRKKDRIDTSTEMNSTNNEVAATIVEKTEIKSDKEGKRVIYCKGDMGGFPISLSITIKGDEIEAVYKNINYKTTLKMIGSINSSGRYVLDAVCTDFKMNLYYETEDELAGIGSTSTNSLDVHLKVYNQN